MTKIQGCSEPSKFSRLTKFEKGIPWTSHTLYAVLRGQGYNKKTQDLNDKRLDWEDVFYYSSFWGKGEALVVLTCADIIWEITRPTQICSTFRWCNSLVTIHLNIWECRKGDATKRERNMGLFPTRPLRDTPSWLKKSSFSRFFNTTCLNTETEQVIPKQVSPPFPRKKTLRTKTAPKTLSIHPISHRITISLEEIVKGPAWNTWAQQSVGLSLHCFISKPEGIEKVWWAWFTQNKLVFCTHGPQTNQHASFI